LKLGELEIQTPLSSGNRYKYKLKELPNLNMVKVKSRERTTENYIRGSIRAYLQGKKDLTWLKGVLEVSDQTILKQVITDYPQLDKLLR